MSKSTEMRFWRQQERFADLIQTPDTSHETVVTKRTEGVVWYGHRMKNSAHPQGLIMQGGSAPPCVTRMEPDGVGARQTTPHAFAPCAWYAKILNDRLLTPCH